MGYSINETHDPNLQSWVESANDPNTDFPIQNLPFCTIETPERQVLCVAIGDKILDLVALERHGLLKGNYSGQTLSELVEKGPQWCFSALRMRLSQLLSHDNPTLRDNTLARNEALRDLNHEDDQLFQHMVPCHTTPNYTDFYASLYHATNVGSMFRPDNPLLPNYKHIPIGYHGRASSIVISGTDVRRPSGQLLPGATVEDGAPVFGPCKMLDYELEMGAIIGRGNTLGEPVSIEDTEDHILGLCILNDWSARDMQKWEYQPLGPFLAKNFASTVSPYIVTMEALAPFRCPAQERGMDDPTPLPYLTSDANTRAGGFDITLEVFIQSEQMRQKHIEPMRISRGNFKDMYWTVAQMLAHHTSNGCNLQPGDLLGSGTISGPTRNARGCLLELTWDGDPWAKEPKLVPGTHRTPIQLPTGEDRKFLADGDEVIMRAFCERNGFRRIGFGECRGRILPPRM